jgi:hypothetical protein
MTVTKAPVASTRHRLVLDPEAGGHVWSTVSCHPTSEGSVIYQRCWCGVWRVLLSGGTPMRTEHAAGRSGGVMVHDAGEQGDELGALGGGQRGQ